MVPQSVRGCLREADARGPAFSRDLHSVTAVTLSFLRPRLTRTTFQELRNQGYLHILGLLLLPEGPLVYWSTKFVSSVPSTLWGGGAVPPLGPTLILCICRLKAPPLILIYIHVHRRLRVQRVATPTPVRWSTAYLHDAKALRLLPAPASSPCSSPRLRPRPRGGRARVRVAKARPLASGYAGAARSPRMISIKHLARPPDLHAQGRPRLRCQLEEAE